MFINCIEKCAYQKDGKCTKNDSSTSNEYISGTVSCPFMNEAKKEALTNQTLTVEG